MKYVILFAAVCGTVLGQQQDTDLTTLYGQCVQNSNCNSDKCCPDSQDRICCGSYKGKCCSDRISCCKDPSGGYRIINGEECLSGDYCVCRKPVVDPIPLFGVEFLLCPTPGPTTTTPSPNVGVVSSHQNCRSDPCNQRCPQNNANRLLAQLDRLSPTDIQGIFKRDEQVSFYLGCVLGTGSCDGVGGAFKEALSDWAVSKQVCGRCNACQKRKVSFIISQLRNNPRYKTRYDQILAKFGGTGK